MLLTAVKSSALSILLVHFVVQAARAEPAFPGAEGFGAESVGGRGGVELRVTTLEDYAQGEPAIAGSLRGALETSGPRFVRFDVGGTIELKAPLRIREPYLTLDGQDAPAPGITLTRHGLSISETHEIIVRYLRVRPGDTSGEAVDGLSIGRSARNIIVDHCSVSWAVDEVLSVSGEGSDKITVQWCIISEALHESVHPKGPHGMGSLLRTDGRVSFHHNLYAHNNSRNPRPGTYGQPPGILLDFRNNVIYNWGAIAGYSAEDPVRMNYIGNYLKPGPSSRNRHSAFTSGGAATTIFQQDNLLVDGNTQMSGWDLFAKLPEAQRQDEPYPAAPVFTRSPETAWKEVLKDAGATLPVRDTMDARIVEEAKTGTGFIIHSQTEVLGR